MHSIKNKHTGKLTIFSTNKAIANYSPTQNNFPIYSSTKLFLLLIALIKSITTLQALSCFAKFTCFDKKQFCTTMASSRLLAPSYSL